MTTGRSAARVEPHASLSAGFAGPSDGTWLTLQEAAQATRRNAELLRRWCVSGRIRGQRFGRDWLLPGAELERIDRMPRRGMRHAPETALGDRGLLSDGVNAELDDCLEPGEEVRVVLVGAEDAALVATDMRLFVVRDGALVHAGLDTPAGWPLGGLAHVQIELGTATGALVVTGRDPTDRAIVLVLTRPHLDRARAGADALRGLLLEAQRR